VRTERMDVALFHKINPCTLAVLIQTEVAGCCRH